MEVILLERVEKLGAIGDVVKVKDGFARNFLLPNKKALRANESNRKSIRSQPRADRGRECRPAVRRRESIEGRRRQIGQADPSGIEHRPALRLGLGPRHRRGARRRRCPRHQEPGRSRSADQGDRPARSESRASSRGRGDREGQRRPLARRSGPAGAGHRRAPDDVRARSGAGGGRGARADRWRCGGHSRSRPTVRPEAPQASTVSAEEAPAANEGEQA